MKAVTGLDPVERAHLVDPTDRTWRIDRHAVPDDLADLARRFWIPVWDVPAGAESHQQVLQYPVCLMVVAPHDARFSGVVPGLATTTLSGSGWAVGLMLQPAAGALLTGDPVDRWTDRAEDLGDVLGAPGARLVEQVRAAMSAGPDRPGAQREAMDAFTDLLRTHLPVDDEGLLVNRLVAAVEDDPALLRVEDLCDRFGIAERALQRLVRRRTGLSPKWLIQRRRLQEAAERLRDGEVSLAQVAAQLGYADQPHFTRDFRRVTGLTPGRFAGRFR
ncbi:helix-turn-helix transcriptional regulator [Cellulomonas sp. Sa3CUA2]|uniref:Helix-turn-helix transcriptional regulator n=1 Tax=Cellulomonas avistercoris TaxID=2762242 RepID=A0ABR8QI99_9CELL|nr:helix-turn-helix transcriptional regulator [Cellulomonas avistercoris]MBD7920148.1 helix-turn-helix transcriptional regulator [Cellulomonas avistercoris]